MSTNRPCNTLLIGICGSIHAAHIYSYLLRLRESFADEIKVIMTESAARMVDPKTVGVYTDDRVFIDLWDRSESVSRAPHIQLPRWSDLFLILPASANILGKAANGIADDLLSTAILSSPKPLVFAPAMNPSMWESKAVQRNVETLRHDGHYVIPPEHIVSVTSGEWDLGLGPTPETILPHLQHFRMKELQAAYWDEATSTKPLTPAQKKVRELVLAAKQRDGLGENGGPSQEAEVAKPKKGNEADTLRRNGGET